MTKKYTIFDKWAGIPEDDAWNDSISEKRQIVRGFRSLIPRENIELISLYHELVRKSYGHNFYSYKQEDINSSKNLFYFTELNNAVFPAIREEINKSLQRDPYYMNHRMSGFFLTYALTIDISRRNTENWMVSYATSLSKDEIRLKLHDFWITSKSDCVFDVNKYDFKIE